MQDPQCPILPPPPSYQGKTQANRSAHLIDTGTLCTSTERRATLVYGTPQPVLPVVKRDDYFIEVPLVPLALGQRLFLWVVVRVSAVVAISFHGESMKPSGACL
jgi:hypothetical protein